MGYEVKLIVGEQCHTTDKLKRSENGEIEGESVYYPYERDENGEFIKTGIKHTYFMICAEIDLCKIGECNLSKALKVNHDKNHEWYWYDGNIETSSDCYGDKPEPISIHDCITALELDSEGSDYRRFKWALGMLKAIRDNDGHEMQVIWYGH